MKEDEDIAIVYTKKEEIQKIVDKFKEYSFDKLKKRSHYYYSLYQKDTNEQELIYFYQNFNKIEMITFRKRKNGTNNYDVFYKKDDGTYIIYAISLDTIPPTLINAYPVSRNFEEFKKYIIKKYWKEMV